MYRIASKPVQHSPVPSAQRGAVLFIALIMLVVLSLIGIASMQVTTLQERMAGNYYTLGRAFENAEWAVRDTERNIDTTVSNNTRFPVNDNNTCVNKDMDNWAQGKGATGGKAVYVARIDSCVTGAGHAESILKGKKVSDNPNGGKYQITAVNSDNTATPANSASLVVVESVYYP